MSKPIAAAITKTAAPVPSDRLHDRINRLDDYLLGTHAEFRHELLDAAVGIESTTCARVLDALDELREELASIRADLIDR